MVGFEPGYSEIGSDRPANCAPTAAQMWLKIWRFISKWYWIIFNRNKFRESKKSREKLFCLLVDQPVCVSGKPEYELMQTAWRERNPDARIKAAKDAIVLNPECATAYILLAEVKSFVIYEVVFSHTAEKWKNQDI